MIDQLTQVLSEIATSLSAQLAVDGSVTTGELTADGGVLAGGLSENAVVVSVSFRDVANGTFILALAPEVLGALDPSEVFTAISQQFAAGTGAQLDNAAQIDAGSASAILGGADVAGLPVLLNGAPCGVLAISTEASTADSVEFETFDAPTTNITSISGHPLELLNDVEMGVAVELGRTRMSVKDILNLNPGAVVELDRAAGSPVDLLVNGTLIARGEVVVIDEEFGIRITELVGHEDGKRKAV